MKKSFICWLIASAVMMLGLPWIAVAFMPGDTGMALCFLLFYAINPIYFVMLGAFAGRRNRRLWSLLVISAGLFLCSVWIFFDIGEIWFIRTAVIYLVLGMAAMLIPVLWR